MVLLHNDLVEFVGSMLLSFAMQIAGKINKIIRDMGLRELGQLEQDIVFGDAGTKEIITFLRAHQVFICTGLEFDY